MIKAKVKKDAVSKNGRAIEIQWETDSPLLNSYLKLPALWSKTFDATTPYNIIQEEFSAYTRPIVQKAEASLNSGMRGKSFKVDV